MSERIEIEINQPFTAKVEKVEFKREWNGNNGTIYYHDVTMSNGHVVSIGKKKLNDIEIGKEYKYKVDENGRFIDLGYLENRRNAPAPGARKKPTFQREPYHQKIAGFALSYSKDLVISDKIPLEQLITMSDKLYNWLLSKENQ